MDFSIATLLATFPDEKLVAPKALEKKLDCEEEDCLRRLQITLDALERIGILTKERGKYRRLFDDDMVEGRLRCSSKGFCFAIQDVEGAEDVYVRESHLNTAWNSDRVLIKVTKEGSRRRSPEGEVRLILERANTSVLAKIKKTDSGFRAVPLDDRLLFELDLVDGDPDLNNAIDHLVHVEIVRYPLGQNPPLGRVVKILGSDAEAASDIDIVSCKHDLPREFSKEVLQVAQSLPTKLRKTDLKKRLDLRDVETITIDGTGANYPLDNALSLKKLKGNKWQLGVHIADVSAYVAERSPLDQEAQKRGNSIYLGDVTLPMLPEAVHQCCALEPNQERLTVSVLITLTDSGEVEEFELQPSVIQVDHSLTYMQAQAIIQRAHPEQATDRPYELPTEQELKPFAGIFELIDQLFILSQALKAQRHQRGAFDLNLPERVCPTETNPTLGKFLTAKFQYDDEGALGAMITSEVLPARAIISESLVLANQLLASHVQTLGVPALYRLQRTPDAVDIQELLKLLLNMGIEHPFPEEDEEVHPLDYQQLTQKFAQSRIEKVLTYLLVETLRPATYSLTPGLHFGLALETAYGHFTSPLRRYTDLLNQRVLHAIFDHGRDRKSTRAKEIVDLHSSSCHDKISWNVLPPDIHSQLEEHFAPLAVYLTEREKLAQEAEADLEGLKKAEFMQQHTGEIFQGVITGVQSYGFFVEIADLLVEGLVHVSSLKDDWYEYRSRQQKLVGRKNRKQYRLGDRVEVQVKSVDYYRQQIDLVAVGGGSEAGEDDSEDTDNEDLSENLSTDETLEDNNLDVEASSDEIEEEVEEEIDEETDETEEDEDFEDEIEEDDEEEFEEDEDEDYEDEDDDDGEVIEDEDEDYEDEDEDEDEEYEDEDEDEEYEDEDED